MATESKLSFQYNVGDLLQRFFRQLSPQELANARMGVDAGWKPTTELIAVFWGRSDAPKEIVKLQSLEDETTLRSLLTRTAVDDMSLIEKQLYSQKLGFKMDNYDSATAQAELTKLRQFADDLVAQTQSSPGESGAPLK